MTTEHARDPISSRGLVSGGLGTPLRDVRGKLAGYRSEERAIEGTNRKSVSVMLQLADLEVLKSIEPYAFPTAEIRIPLSNSSNSRWGIVAESANTIISSTQDFPKDFRNSIIRLTVVGGHKVRTRSDDGKWNETEVEAWEVTEIDGKTKGAASANPMDELKKLLDGKTEAEFTSAVLKLPYVMNTPDAQRSILDRTFQTGLVQSGQFTLDANKVYHKK